MYHIMVDEHGTECNLSSLSNSSSSEIQNANFNKQFISFVDIMECPICFGDIEQSDAVLIVDCCRKKIHLACLIEWYSKYPNNKTCFLCNQSNSFCKDFVYSDNSSQSNNTDTSNNSFIIEVQSSGPHSGRILDSSVSPSSTILSPNSRYRPIIITIISTIFVLGIAATIFHFITHYI